MQTQTLPKIPELQPHQLQALLKGLTAEEKTRLLYDWKRWGRDKQIAPDWDWFVWMVMAGRGFGKTRTGVEWIRSHVEGPSSLIAPPGAPRRIAIVADEPGDIIKDIYEGAGGFKQNCPPWNRPIYNKNLKRFIWPSGIYANCYSAEDPESLRGPNIEMAWCDELGKWRYAEEAWKQLELIVRLGNPRVLVTTTPRPIETIKDLIKRVRGPDNPDGDVALAHGTTYENKANLSPKWFKMLAGTFEGTRMGRQELLAEILEDVEGAFWTRDMIELARAGRPPKAMDRIVVAIDPAVTSGEDADETGLIVAGANGHGLARHGFVLQDASFRATPMAWCKKAVQLYHTWGADRIVAETNNGGDLVETTLRTVDNSVSFKKVTASRGKDIRAEPIAALYEQGRVHHCGSFPELEDQMCTFVKGIKPKKSPDRMDANVWAMTELLLEKHTEWDIF